MRRFHMVAKSDVVEWDRLGAEVAVKVSWHFHAELLGLRNGRLKKKMK